MRFCSSIILSLVLSLPPTCIRADSLSPITNVAACAQLTETDIARKREFDIVGTVVRVRPTAANPHGSKPQSRLWLRDAQSAIDAQGHLPSGIGAGQVVRARGYTDLQNNQFLCQITDIQILPDGSTPPIDSIRVGLRDLSAPAHAGRFVTVRGTITEAFADDIDPGFSYFELTDGSTDLHAAIDNAEISPQDFDALVGAEVDVTGIFLPSNVSFRRHMGPVLFILGKKDIRNLRPASHNPHDYPDCPREGSYSPAEIRAWGVRRMTGRVLVSWQESDVLLRTDDGTIHRIELIHGQPLPENGVRITVAGQPRTDYFHINLKNAFYSTVGPAEPAEGALSSPTPGAFPLNEHGGIDCTHYGRFLRIRGTIVPPPAALHGDFQLFLSHRGHVITVDIGATGRTGSQFETGSTIEASGVCVMDIDNWRPGDMFPKIRGISIVTRSADDIRVIATPSRWTPARFMGAIGVLLVVLAGCLIWNLSLKFLVNRRSRELVREQISHVGAVLKAEERTRLSVELHDSLSQNLAGVACQLDTAEYLLAEDAATAAGHLTTAKRMLLSCQSELKRCLFDLRSDSLDNDDFEEAIMLTLRPVVSPARLVLRFKVPRSRLHDTTAHAIICIVRELVSNAVRHGHATAIHVAGDLTDDRLMFSVRDNGSGFDAEKAPGPGEGHFGLQGIRDRVDRLGGTLTVESGNSGTYAKVSIRLNTEKTSAS